MVAVVTVLLFVPLVVVDFLLRVVVLLCCDADALRCGAGCSCVSLGTKITIWWAFCRNFDFEKNRGK